MEVGAVVAAAPVKNVRRETPIPGDIVILLGGKREETVVEERQVLPKNIQKIPWLYVERKYKRKCSGRKKDTTIISKRKVARMIKNVMILEREEFRLLSENWQRD